MSNLILLRHGQSTWNLQNRFTGFEDPELTDKGIAEALAAGEKIREMGITIDQVFTSTLQRANKTAELALNAAGQGALIDTMVKSEALKERDYGDLTGLDKGETAAKYGDEQVHIWRRSYDVAPPGGECLKDVVGRVGAYYTAEIKPLLDQGKTVLIAAHGNSLRALHIVLGKNTPEDINDLEIATGDPLFLEV